MIIAKQNRISLNLLKKQERITAKENMLDAWLDGMLHFPPFDTNRFKPSIDICDGLTLSKKGFNI